MNTEKLTTIARPYALAAFEVALEKQDLSAWSAVLDMGAIVVNDPDMHALLRNPRVSQKEVLGIFFDILGSNLNEERKNFFHLLASYERLDALPEMAKLYASHREQHDKTVTVELISAVPLSDAYQEKIRQALTLRLKRKVFLVLSQDESLIGGAMIRAGDLVIDGSIRGKLNRLIEFI